MAWRLYASWWRKSGMIDYVHSEDALAMDMIGTPIRWLWEFNTRINSTTPQRTRDAIITSLLSQNDVATSFWRYNDVIITSRVSAGTESCRSHPRKKADYDLQRSLFNDFNVVGKSCRVKLPMEAAKSVSHAQTA